MKPTVRQLKLDRHQYPEWQICPRCRADRGEVYKEFNPETGEYLNLLRICTLCNGERVMPIV